MKFLILYLNCKCTSKLLKARQKVEFNFPCHLNINKIRNWKKNLKSLLFIVIYIQLIILLFLWIRRFCCMNGISVSIISAGYLPARSGSIPRAPSIPGSPIHQSGRCKILEKSRSCQILMVPICIPSFPHYYNNQLFHHTR